MYKMFVKYFEQLTIYLKDHIILMLTTLSIFLGPVNELIFGVFLLCVTDFFTGIFGAYKSKIPITSNRMGDTFVKILLYGFTIIVVHYLDTHFINNIRVNFLNSFLDNFLSTETLDKIASMKFASAVAFLITIRELKSIDENWEKSFKWSFIKTTKNLFSFLKSFKTKKQLDEISN